MKNLRVLLLILIAGFLSIAADTAPKPIKIVDKESPPLVFKDITGFGIDLANIICEKNNLSPEFVMFTSLPDLLGAVASGVYDIEIMTSRINGEYQKIYGKWF
ncbi:transporter substrate-binding domain-containing protein [Desulfosarcina sp.]|uniref:transporter substrate-binding domain-containing protein n=1 Tax=Desulfosarcina sp. TaxID=2027861 RepID=UPI0035687BFC